MANPKPGLKEQQLAAKVDAARVTWGRRRPPVWEPSWPDGFLTSLNDVVTADPRSVWLHGESGSGKELATWTLVAKRKALREGHSVHVRTLDGANEATAPIVALNCAELSETLALSMLFGTRKGAFSDAENRPSIFEVAAGGVLFLDEIADLSKTIQAMLLRVLETWEVKPLGAEGIVLVDDPPLVIAATNVPIQQRIAEGAFRPDLFARLAHRELTVPSLRGRAESDLRDLLRAMQAPRLGERLLRALEEREGEIPTRRALRALIEALLKLPTTDGTVEKVDDSVLASLVRRASERHCKGAPLGRIAEEIAIIHARQRRLSAGSLVRVAERARGVDVAWPRNLRQLRAAVDYLLHSAQTQIPAFAGAAEGQLEIVVGDEEIDEAFDEVGALAASHRERRGARQGRDVRDAVYRCIAARRDATAGRSGAPVDPEGDPLLRELKDKKRLPWLRAAGSDTPTALRTFLEEDESRRDESNARLTGLGAFAARWLASLFELPAEGSTAGSALARADGRTLFPELRARLRGVPVPARREGLTLPPGYAWPHRLFGRDDLVLRSALCTLSGKKSRLWLHGGAGVGKTAVALHIANEWVDWIPGRSAEVVNCSRGVRLATAGCRDADSQLLVLDNVADGYDDGIEELAVRYEGAILVTSRGARQLAWFSDREVRVPNLVPEAVRQWLVAEVEASEDDARRICRALAGEENAQTIRSICDAVHVQRISLAALGASLGSATEQARRLMWAQASDGERRVLEQVTLFKEDTPLRHELLAAITGLQEAEVADVLERSPLLRRQGRDRTASLSHSFLCTLEADPIRRAERYQTSYRMLLEACSDASLVLRLVGGDRDGKVEVEPMNPLDLVGQLDDASSQGGRLVLAAIARGGSPALEATMVELDRTRDALKSLLRVLPVRVADELWPVPPRATADGDDALRRRRLFLATSLLGIVAARREALRGMTGPIVGDSLDRLLNSSHEITQRESASEPRLVPRWRTRFGSRRLRGSTLVRREILAIACAGKWVVAGADDGSVLLWERGEEPVVIWRHAAQVSSVAARLEGGVLQALSGSDDSSAMIARRPETGPWRPKTRKQPDWVNAVAFTAEGRALLAGDRREAAPIWFDIDEPLGGPASHDKNRFILDMDCVGRHVLIALGTGELAVYDAEDPNTPPVVFPVQKNQYLRGLARLDERHVASIGDDGWLRVVDFVAQRVTAEREAHCFTARAIASRPSPDGAFVVATGGSDGMVRLFRWAKREGEQLLEPHELLTDAAAEVRWLEFHDDELLGGCSDGRVYRWSVPTSSAPEPRSDPRVWHDGRRDLRVRRGSGESYVLVEERVAGIAGEPADPTRSLRAFAHAEIDPSIAGESLAPARVSASSPQGAEDPERHPRAAMHRWISDRNVLQLVEGQTVIAALVVPARIESFLFTPDPGQLHALKGQLHVLDEGGLSLYSVG